MFRDRRRRREERVVRLDGSDAQEIAKNRGVELSFERIRKLRKVASAFPPGRRRPGISLEAIWKPVRQRRLTGSSTAPRTATLSHCSYIRRLKHPTEKAEQDQQKAERRRQIEDQRTALQSLCRQEERKKEKLLREKEERERQYTALCRSIGKEPEPISPQLHQTTNRPYPLPKILSKRFDFC